MSDTVEKRKAGDATGDANKKQKTIDDTMGVENGHGKEEAMLNGKEENKSDENEKAEDPNTLKTGDTNAFKEVKSSPADVHSAAKAEQDSKTEAIHANEDSVKVSKDRETAIPSSIKEKGIIYFFFRSRVGVEDPHGVEDVARSYIVLRPLPLGAKIGSGPLEDTHDARLLALPKKILPRGGFDKFLVFVERQGVSIKELREQFGGAEYATKTTGTSNAPAATPVAEGVYAITMTGNTSHLAYQITMPSASSFGDIQNELGVKEKGSFGCSVKNPTASGPANATIDNPAVYPESIMKKFGGRRWCPLEPAMLNFAGTQLLLIGDQTGLEKAMEEQSKDKRDDQKDKPVEEVERLGEEDHERVQGLEEDDPVFADLGMSSKEYPHLQTTW